MGGTSCDVALDPRWRPVGGEPRQDRGPRPRGADDGHQHGERRRRHDRPGRPVRHAAGRPRQRRRDAGPRLLRPRRHRADHHRLQPAARAAQPRQLPRRPHAARCGGGARGGRDARRRAARRWTSRRPPRASCASSTSRWRRPSRRSPPCAATTCATSCCSPSAAPGRCMPARIARDLGMAGVIVPLYPGVYSAIGLLMSDVKHDYVQSKMDAIAALAPGDVDGDVRAAGGAGGRRAAPPTDSARRRSGCSAPSTCATPGRATRSRSRATASARRRPARTARAHFDARHQADVRPQRAGRAGRDRVLPGARHRQGAAGRDAAVRARRDDARRRVARDAAGAVRRRDDRVPGLSAREARRRLARARARRCSTSSTAPR